MKRSHRAWIVPLAAALVLTGCAQDGRSLVDDTLDGGGIQPTLASIQTNVFSAICTNCHVPGGPGPMPLDSEDASYANLVNVQSTEVNLLRVAPGDPDNSYLVAKILGVPGILGDRMPPPPEPALTQEEIDAIVEWIRQGAPR